MEKKGIIARESQVGDARLKKITLTQKSIEIQKNIENEIKKVEDSLKNNLTKEEINKFMEILQKMSKNIEK